MAKLDIMSCSACLLSIGACCVCQLAAERAILVQRKDDSLVEHLRCLDHVYGQAEEDVLLVKVFRIAHEWYQSG